MSIGAADGASPPTRARWWTRRSARPCVRAARIAARPLEDPTVSTGAPATTAFCRQACRALEANADLRRNGCQIGARRSTRSRAAPTTSELTPGRRRALEPRDGARGYRRAESGCFERLGCESADRLRSARATASHTIARTVRAFQACLRAGVTQERPRQRGDRGGEDRRRARSSSGRSSSTWRRIAASRVGWMKRSVGNGKPLGTPLDEDVDQDRRRSSATSPSQASGIQPDHDLQPRRASRKLRSARSGGVSVTISEY